MTAVGLLRARHVEEARKGVAGGLDRLRWSADQLAAERRRRLRRLVEVARDRSAWHAGRLAGVDVDRLDEAGLANLPSMSKHDVMAHFDEIVADPRLTLEAVEAHLARLGAEPEYLLDGYLPVTTSGSSGVRGVFLYGWDAWTECFLGGFRYLLRDLGGRSFSMAVVAAGSAAHISRAILQTFSDPEVVRVQPLPITLPLDVIVDGLNAGQPDTLLAYPSGLLRLADAVLDGRLRIAPKAIVTAGEPLTPEVRQVAEETFGVPLLNWWVTSEAGPMGIGCGRGPWLHLSDDLIIVEPVDAHGRPVGIGEESAKVLLTNLYNPVLPLIRYEVTDRVTLVGGSCPCGSQHRLVGDVQGRLDDSFAYGEVIVHPHVFRSVLAHHRGVVEFRVTQTRTGADLEVRGAADTAVLAAEAEAALARLGVPRPQVTVRAAERFDRAETGKVHRFVALPTPATVA